MQEYRVFVNGKYQGSIKTRDIVGFIKETYLGVRFSVDEDERLVADS